jgi:hypothetical protein
MPEVPKFVTFLYKPPAIHPIQVHSFRKSGIVSSVSSSGFWFSFQGREVIVSQTGNKATVDLLA